jgi:hypothetical protein
LVGQFPVIALKDSVNYFPAGHPSTGLAGSWVELGTERESLLQVLDENANFGGQAAAGRPYGKDRHGSLKGSQKTDDTLVALQWHDSKLLLI